MKLLFIADGRSPIALNWISHFIRQGHTVHLVSTSPCEAVEGLASLEIIPIAMSSLYRSAEKDGGGATGLVRRLLPVGMRTRLRQMLAPASLPGAAKALKTVIEGLQPELIHAMRIPYEGMLASKALKLISMEKASRRKLPLVISVWGNDFTLHANSSPSMLEHIRETLKRADGLHTDCERDRRLAVELGYDGSRPSIVLPGGGGVQLDIFYPPAIGEEKAGPATVINPRGFRAYVCNDTFFHAIPLVLATNPGVRFICPGMMGEGQAEGWISELHISDAVELLPRQARQQMAALFQQSEVMVSVTTHDGTPNTLLEGMACGCFPIAGDIESIREWITDHENGLLVDPGDERALAAAIREAIEQPEMRRVAREKNLQLVRERAEYGMVMKKAEEFYRQMIEVG
jgi:glycosyltransferase involved in cell wall biosynthesis